MESLCIQTILSYLIIPRFWKTIWIKSVELHTYTWVTFKNINMCMRVLSACLYILTRLDSVNAIVHSLSKFLIKILLHVQNISARLISGSSRYGNGMPVLQEVHWLPAQQRICYGITVSGFKCVLIMCPDYLHNHGKLYIPGLDELRSSNGTLRCLFRKWETFIVRGILDTIVRWSETHWHMAHAPRNQ